MKKDPSQDYSFYIIGWSAILFVLGTVVLNVLFDIKLTQILPPCILHKVTGWYCLGCGGTRAAAALMRGDIVQSLFYHPIVIYMAVVGGWFMISQTIERLTKGKVAIGMHFRLIYIWIGVGLAVINCVWKNAVLLLTGEALM